MTTTEVRPESTDQLVARVLRTLDRSGDSPIYWTPGNDTEEAGARAHFDLLRHAGYAAYRRGEGDNRETVHSWDEARESGEIVMVPQPVGG